MRPVFLSLLFLIPQLLLAFEGTVEYRFDSKGMMPISKMTHFIKPGNRLRAQILGTDGTKSAVVYDSKAKKSYTLMPKTKQYMVTDLRKNNKSTKKDKPAKITATGEKTTIAGYLCEKFLIEDNKGTDIFWAALNFAPFLAYGMGSDEAVPAGLQARFKKGNMYPFRVILKGDQGRPPIKMEAVKVTKKKLSANLFKIPPPGYTQYKTPAMPDMSELFKNMPQDGSPPSDAQMKQLQDMMKKYQK